MKLRCRGLRTFKFEGKLVGMTILWKMITEKKSYYKQQIKDHMYIKFFNFQTVCFIEKFIELN